MARNLSPVVKMSRREGYALHPKAHKALVKRSTLPGQQGRNQRNKTSQYSLQLREKQKVKRLYGLLEKQFAKLVDNASRTSGQTGERLLQLLELRADNTVYRGGFAPSRRAARQLVTHGHFLLNGKRIDVPSMRLKIGDELKARPHSLKTSYFSNLETTSPSPAETPSWIKADRKKVTVKVVGLPPREEAEPDINDQLIVEYYSR